MKCKVNYSDGNWQAWSKSDMTESTPNPNGWVVVSTCVEGKQKPYPNWDYTEEYNGLCYLEAWESIKKDTAWADYEFTTYNPYTREFPEIDYKKLESDKEHCFVALMDAAIQVSRSDAAQNRIAQARSKLSGYIRPETKPFSALFDLKLKTRILPTEKGCWIWLGKINSQGYGQYYLKSKSWLAHRLIFTLLVGEIPESGVLLHQCDNRMCVNPEHLQVGSNHDNILDMHRKGRSNCFISNSYTPEEGLTREQLRQIRLAYFTENITPTMLGKQYGISKFTVLAIVDYLICV
jgi:hypothetical protein